MAQVPHDSPQALHHYCANICCVAQKKPCNNNNLLHEQLSKDLFLCCVPKKDYRLFSIAITWKDYSEKNRLLDFETYFRARLSHRQSHC